MYQAYTYTYQTYIYAYCFFSYRFKKSRKGRVFLCFHHPHIAQSCHFYPGFDQFNIDDEKVEACVAQTQEGHLVAMYHGGLKPHGSWTTFTGKKMCKLIEKFGAGQATQKQPGILTQGVLASQQLSDLGEHSKKNRRCEDLMSCCIGFPILLVVKLFGW